MSERRRWILVLAGGGLLTVGLAGLIVWQMGRIETTREEISTLQSEIQAGRKLISTTGDLEREVILQRETDEVIREILPSDDDVINFARTLRDFEEQSGVQMYYVQESTVSSREKTDFTKVSYDVKFQGDAFQTLAFIDLVESHPRFMSLPHFKLTAMQRNAMLNDPDSPPQHSVQLNVETYVYEPKGGEQGIKIEGYDRKRDLLLSEISRRRQELQVRSYDYQGARSRRDPWVDPRVPRDDDKIQLTIEQQIALVDEKVLEVADVQAIWAEVLAATSLIEESLKRQALEEGLVHLESEIRRIEDQGLLDFISASKRFNVEVVAVLEALRAEVAATEGTLGPSLEHLQEVADAMREHLQNGEPGLALEAYHTISDRLELAERYEDRRPWCEQIRAWAHTAEAFIAFEKIDLDVTGVLVHESFDPIATINGDSVGEGSMLESGVLVRQITKDEIEFLFQGVIFSRAIDG